MPIARLRDATAANTRVAACSSAGFALRKPCAVWNNVATLRETRSATTIGENMATKKATKKETAKKAPVGDKAGTNAPPRPSGKSAKKTAGKR
jgi:hypothetical protein